jgi:poly-gamma-glutamate synthesis protein (capsule biosynthesis protein)
MVSHANNHAFDYGSEGVLQTLEHVAAAGIALSGSGEDLQAARRAAMRTVRGVRVAHVAMAETFVEYGRASRSRGDARGRPGVNPLTTVDHTEIEVTPGVAATMKRLDRWLGRDVARYDQESFRRFGRRFRIGRRNRIRRGKRLVSEDRSENLAAIADAAATADLTIVSIHSHDLSKGTWRQEFPRDAVAAGADVVLMHGPHETLGIELVEGHPILQCLGNFVFQPHQFTALPSDAYDEAGLDDSAGPTDLIRAKAPSWGLNSRAPFEGCAAMLEYASSRLRAISLLPIDLQFDGDEEKRGRPRLADRALGRRIILDIAAKSTRFGTVVRYEETGNVGIVELG